MGSGTPETEKRERHFGEDVLGNENGSLREEDARRFRENVMAQQIEIGSAEASGGTDEVTFFYAEDNAADQTSGARPPNHSNDDYDEEKCFERADRERQKRAQGKEEIEPGKTREKVRRRAWIDPSRPAVPK